MSYYLDKVESLKDLFGTTDVEIGADFVRVGSTKYSVKDDVILLDVGATTDKDFAPDIQYTFGEEWKAYDKILPEHEALFKQYFDLIDIETLKNKRVCDLGSGAGRFSYFLAPLCRELVCVDFSDAIFVTRKNLRDRNNVLFFRCDIKRLPFRDDSFDIVCSLGVLHHLPTPCLNEVRALKRFAPELLIYLYYSLDNRPLYYRWLLGVVNAIRLTVSRIRSTTFRKAFSVTVAATVYVPLVWLGRLLDIANVGKHVPLYEGYKDLGFKQIEQDVYDRFFTRIEQRVSRKEIEGLRDTFRQVIVSDGLPYHHFLCRR